MLDLPDDYFRIRLVCTLLDTCSGCFDRGTAKKKLDFFLTFFQVRPCEALGRTWFTHAVLDSHERVVAHGH